MCSAADRDDAGHFAAENGTEKKERKTQQQLLRSSLLLLSRRAVSHCYLSERLLPSSGSLASQWSFVCCPPRQDFCHCAGGRREMSKRLDISTAGQKRRAKTVERDDTGKCQWRKGNNWLLQALAVLTKQLQKGPIYNKKRIEGKAHSVTHILNRFSTGTVLCVTGSGGII